VPRLTSTGVRLSYESLLFSTKARTAWKGAPVVRSSPRRLPSSSPCLPFSHVARRVSTCKGALMRTCPPPGSGLSRSVPLVYTNFAVRGRAAGRMCVLLKARAAVVPPAINQAFSFDQSAAFRIEVYQGRLRVVGKLLTRTARPRERGCCEGVRASPWPARRRLAVAASRGPILPRNLLKSFWQVL
jgi:hypothetical protein